MQLRPVESKWEEIGDALSISQDKLKTIKNSTTGKDLDCLVEMCDEWIKKVFDRECQPTWRAVGRALVRADCQELAKDIKGIYDTGAVQASLRLVKQLACNRLSAQVGLSPTSPSPPLPSLTFIASNCHKISVALVEYQSATRDLQLVFGNS